MYHDVLIKIKNAQSAGKKMIKVPYNVMDSNVLDVLLKKGYISRLEKKGRGYKRILAVGLNNEKQSIQDVKFISKPSRRIYVGYKELRSVRQGFGTSVLSTPKGILSGDEARKAKTGGEMLFHIW
ncbi:MAG TPA: 30S ribosomal protein S8 [Candidatus Paceibacterota bacterium]